MNKKQFQSRKDYNPLDSYVFVDDDDVAQEWWKTQNTENPDERWNKDGAVMSSALAGSAQSEWLAFINSSGIAACLQGSTTDYPGWATMLEEQGRDEVIARILARTIQHEVGHPKFDLHPKDDLMNEIQVSKKDAEVHKTGGAGGHVLGQNIMNGAYTVTSIDYDEYMLAVLKTLHGTVSGVKLPENPQALTSALSLQNDPSLYYEDKKQRYTSTEMFELGKNHAKLRMSKRKDL
jgi:hypothetical protein